GVDEAGRGVRVASGVLDRLDTGVDRLRMVGGRSRAAEGRLAGADAVVLLGVEADLRGGAIASGGRMVHRMRRCLSTREGGLERRTRMGTPWIRRTHY
ncbi:hypothetical protein FRC06_000850, partial [Ceratobasidium sp. 370]